MNKHYQSNIEKNQKLQITMLKIIIFVTLSLVLLTIIPLYNSFLGHPLFLLTAINIPSSSSSYVPDDGVGDISVLPKEDECDMFSGEWVPNPEAPYYTNETCWAIHEHQNCVKYGRPDRGFMKWKWQPNGCDLPVFNPAQFLELVRDKSLAFVGDSVGRNHMQSMICLLSRVEYPVDESTSPDENFKIWRYKTHNFTLATFWSPHLVRTDLADPSGPTRTGLFSLHLDAPDPRWSRHISSFDHVVLNAGHWFYRPMLYYDHRRLVGCHFCNLPNVTDLNKFFGYRHAFRTAFRAINNLPDFKGTVILRTFAPSHFENGLWNEGGDCVRRKPLAANVTVMEGIDLEFYLIQLEEFRAAEREGRERGKGVRYRLMDTTMAMLMRPDGHPSRYGHRPGENVTLYNDCVHWCLPGPIDTWSDFLLQMLKMEGRRSYREGKASERKMRFR